MKDYKLSKEKIAELEKFHRSLRDKRQAHRWLLLRGVCFLYR
jgi:hypothetical protein